MTTLTHHALARLSQFPSATKKFAVDFMLGIAFSE
jgi:hypothetical protein